jgi:hypothetical protein
MAIPLQTIKILGALVGDGYPFDRHALSFYTKADGGHHPPFAPTNGAGRTPTGLLGSRMNLPYRAVSKHLGTMGE